MAAVDQSWICVEEEDTCWFIWLQQFNRAEPDIDRYFEASFMIFICCLAIPANVYLIRKCYKTRMLLQLLILISILASCNIFFSQFGYIFATARLQDSWTMGDGGCIAFWCGSMFFLTLSIWTLTLISIERQICICQPISSPTLPVNKWHLVTAMVFLLVLDASFWCFVFFYQRLAHTREFFVKQLPQSKLTYNKNVTVCNLFAYTFDGNLEKSSILLSVVIVMSLVVIPLPIIIYCYWRMWQRVRNSFRFNSQIASAHERRRASTLPSNWMKHIRRRRETTLAKVMFMAIIIFIVCYTPVSGYLIYIAFQPQDLDHANSLNTQTRDFYICFYFVYVNAVFSPLIQAWRSNRKSKSWKCFKPSSSLLLICCAKKDQEED